VPPFRRGHVDSTFDRTTTIRASVNDIEFTLLLTVALVVMVIFLILRNAWADDHVPASLCLYPSSERSE